MRDDPDQPTALQVGQTWIPTRAGSGWRYICEVDGEPGAIRYRLASGNMRRDWAWQLRDWIRRYECILKENPCDPRTDAALDKQYRLGYEQAWREWSAVVSETERPVRQESIERMNDRLREVQNR